VHLVNAADMAKALQLSGHEFKGSAIKVEVSQKKAQPEAAAKTQEKSGKAGKTGKTGQAKAGGQEQTDKGIFLLEILTL